MKAGLLFPGKNGEISAEELSIEPSIAKLQPIDSSLRGVSYIELC